MKKINYFLSALVVGFSLTSCYDDDAINKVNINTLSDITLSVSSSNSVTGEGFVVPFTATLPQTFDTDVTIEALLDFDGGEVRSTFDVPAGSTSMDATITMQGDDALSKFSGRPVTLSLSGLSVSGAEAGDTTAFNVISNEVEITSFDRVQWPYADGVINGRMTALFDWENPGANDLDMLMFNADTFDQVESAASGSRWETDIFDDTHPDGNYFVAIDFWIASGDIPWKIFFVHPDQQTISSFEGVFEGAASGDFVFPLINFTKSTDTEGNVSYTFSEPTS